MNLENGRWRKRGILLYDPLVQRTRPKRNNLQNQKMFRHLDVMFRHLDVIIGEVL
jgi:hypothetical protein